MINRRQWLYGVGAMAGAAAQSGGVPPPNAKQPEQAHPYPLNLSDFVPTSMLQVGQTRVERARFPV